MGDRSAPVAVDRERGPGPTRESPYLGGIRMPASMRIDSALM